MSSTGLTVGEMPPRVPLPPRLLMGRRQWKRQEEPDRILLLIRHCFALAERLFRQVRDAVQKSMETMNCIFTAFLLKASFCCGSAVLQRKSGQVRKLR